MYRGLALTESVVGTITVARQAGAMGVDRHALAIVPQRLRADLLGTGGSHVRADAGIAHR